jgi:hypothetical protein
MRKLNHSLLLILVCYSLAYDQRHLDDSQPPTLYSCVESRGNIVTLPDEESRPIEMTTGPGRRYGVAKGMHEKSLSLPPVVVK